MTTDYSGLTIDELVREIEGMQKAVADAHGIIECYARHLPEYQSELKRRCDKLMAETGEKHDA